MNTLSHVQEPLVCAVLDVLQAGSLVMLQSNSSQVFKEMLHQFASSCPHKDINSLKPVALDGSESQSTRVDGATDACMTQLDRNPFGVMSETEAVTLAGGKTVHRTVLQAR